MIGKVAPMIEYNLQYFGGRGASSSVGGSSGEQVHNAYTAISNNREPLKELERLSGKMKISEPVTTANGNSIKLQVATIDNGTEKIDIAFHSAYNPIQTTGTPKKAIETKITATLWENGNAKAIRTLASASSKSYKNAGKQYTDILKEWQKVTGQKRIRI